MAFPMVDVPTVSAKRCERISMKIGKPTYAAAKTGQFAAASPIHASYQLNELLPATACPHLTSKPSQTGYSG